jgi:glycosyltransferase involved in cell wall biosynthesis
MGSMTKHILFHHPLPLNEGATSASGLRPVRMLRAFRSLGYEVDVVTGYVRERSASMSAALDKIRRGRRYEFMYAESSTVPTALTEPHHLPIAPLIDARFFSCLKKNSIPISLFYRDIYWMFENYGEHLALPKRVVSKFFYKHDLRWYNRNLTRLYLPSMEMANYMPKLQNVTLDTLPPGVDLPTASPTFDLQVGQLRLLYVGGISSHYQMHKLFEVVARTRGVHLTVCTRASEWCAVKADYARWMSPNIEVVHQSGVALENLFLQCDLTMLYVKPGEYWQFAVPVKLYEYLGWQRPIVASQGTLSGQFVEDQGVGWAIPYEATALEKLLASLMIDHVNIRQKAEMCARVAPLHTWQARAQQVASDLRGTI